jgi:hypothetical protein
MQRGTVIDTMKKYYTYLEMSRGTPINVKNTVLRSSIICTLTL